MIGCEGVCPVATAVAAVLVALAVAKFLFARKVPTVQVHMEPAEKEDVIEGPSHKDMKLQDPNRPGYVQCFDPSTLQHLGEVKAMTADDVNEIVRRARIAQQKWAKTTFAERKHVLNVLQKYITTHTEEICRVSSRDSGKPKVDAMLGEVLTTCEKIRCTLANGEKWLAPEYRPTGPLMMHKTAFVEFHPLGVLGVIAPWNYPFHNIYNHVISGLFSGNALVFKVSEYTSWSSGYYMRIIHEVLRVTGHDPDLVQVVTGFAEAGAALVASDVDKIIFTGSPGVGKRVMAGAAPHLKPVVLELGGKDPFIVCEDADIEAVLPIAMRGTFQNAGQNCCGVERVYVYEGVYEKFCKLAVQNVKQMRQGNPLGKEPVDIGSMIMPMQIDIVQELVDDAVAKGARLLAGGKRNPDLPNGLFYMPTVLADVTHDMRIANEEVFGPVMTIFKVENNDDDKCIEMVNSTNYGLGSSVFSGNQARATRIGQRIHAGMTTINDFAVNYLVQSLPFGGVKHSGFDRFAGPEGLRGCCLMKSVVVDKFSFMKTTLPKVIQYPVGDRSFTFANAMVAVMFSSSIKERIKAIFDMIRS